MTRHFPPPPPEATAISAILIDAARCWREARDSGQSVQPCLSKALDEYGCTMLAPVLDSLCLFYEAALGRPMTVGQMLVLSADEHMLLGLMDGTWPRPCLNFSKAAGTVLDCALCSTGIMLTITLGNPAVPRRDANKVRSITAN